MVEVDLVAPILLTQAALPHLRASGDGLVINVTSGIALIGAPFYATNADPATLRLSFATADDAKIREGVQRLVKALG